MTKDGMVTAWSAGMYDQRWNGHSLELERLQLESTLVAVQGTVIEEVVMVSLSMTGSHFEAYNLNAKRALERRCQ